MLLFNTLLCLVLAAFVLLIMFQIGLMANLAIISQNPDKVSHPDLIQSPAGVLTFLETEDGGRVACRHRGSGEPMILIPDVGVSCASMNQLWEHLASYGYQVITFDWRGYGDSEAGAEGMTLQGMAQDLQAVLMWQRSHKATLLAHATGAFITLQTLQSQKGILPSPKALVCMGAFGQGNFISNRTQGVLARLGEKLKLESLLSRRLFGWGYVAPIFGDRVAPSMMKAYLDLHLARPLSRLKPLWEELTQQDLLSSLKKLSIPTLLLASKGDRRVPPLESIRLARALPKSQLIWMSGEVGNMLPWEASKSVVERSRDFLNDLDTKKDPVSIC